MEFVSFKFISLILIHVISFVIGKIQFDKLATLYLPYAYQGNGTGLFGYDKGAVETLAYDSSDRIIYTAGKQIIQVIDLRDVRNPTVVSYKTLKGSSEITDIAFCGGFVIVTRKDGERPDRGFIDIYRRYNRQRYNLQLLHVIRTGSGPEDITTTSDCRKILIAIEGEPYAKGNRLIDPLGGVAVITFPTSDLSGRYAYRMVDFTPFIDRTAELIRNGTRYVYRSPGNTIAHDLEPESVTISDDETTAYISLQENNAIAEFDMRTNTITAIRPLGFKNWRFSRFDASDKDNGIQIRSWPVFGMYQPDSIKYMDINGHGYIVSANEGDSKDFSGDVPNGFSEEVRAGDLTINGRSAILTWADANGFADRLQLPSNLGRLEVTNRDGKMQFSNQYRNLFTFGARSFSIWRARDMRQKFDSGSDIEDAMSRFRPSLFNSDPGDAKIVATTTADTVSDNKGPEPETIEVGDYRGRKLIFVGLEQPGGILLYSVGNNVRQPRFEDIWVGIPSDPIGSWEQMYNRMAVSELDVESLRFVPAIESPTGEPLLIASGSVSGTVSIFQINDRSAGFSCRDRPNGLYVDPHDCSKYYNCHYGTAFQMTCPQGLHFSQTRGYCDWPANVKC